MEFQEKYFIHISMSETTNLSFNIITFTNTCKYMKCLQKYSLFICNIFACFIRNKRISSNNAFFLSPLDVANWNVVLSQMETGNSILFADYLLKKKVYLISISI
jgi:hypothetical protein